MPYAKALWVEDQIANAVKAQLLPADYDWREARDHGQQWHSSGTHSTGPTPGHRRIHD